MLRLGKDVRRLVLKKLGDKDIINLLRVNKEFYNIISGDNYFWRQRYLDTFEIKSGIKLEKLDKVEYIRKLNYGEWKIDILISLDLLKGPSFNSLIVTSKRCNIKNIRDILSLMNISEEGKEKINMEEVYIIPEKSSKWIKMDLDSVPSLKIDRYIIKMRTFPIYNFFN